MSCAAVSACVGGIPARKIYAGSTLRGREFSDSQFPRRVHTEPSLVVPPETIEGFWWCVQTRHQHELSLVADLSLWFDHDRGEADPIGCYCPTYTVTKRWNKRAVVEREVPLFPGFVFVAVKNSHQFNHLHENRSVTNLMRVVMQEQFKRQIQAIYETHKGENPNLPQPGESCRISTRHPLRALHGQTGIYGGLTPKGEALIVTKMLGDELPLYVEPDFVEAA